MSTNPIDFSSHYLSLYYKLQILLYVSNIKVSSSKAFLAISGLKTNLKQVLTHIKSS